MAADSVQLPAYKCPQRFSLPARRVLRATLCEVLLLRLTLSFDRLRVLPYPFLLADLVARRIARCLVFDRWPRIA